MDKVFTVHQERIEASKAAEKQKVEEEEKAKSSLSQDQPSDQNKSDSTADFTSLDENMDTGMI